MNRTTLAWAFAALLGIALTAAVTWAASTIVSQHIGLSSQPASVVNSLAPQPASARSAPGPARTRRHRRHRAAAPPPTTTVSPAVTASPPAVTVPAVVTRTVGAPPVTHAGAAPVPARRPGTDRGDSSGRGSGRGADD